MMIDGAHSVADAKNLANYLKTIDLPKYGVWSMTKNKDPDLFIKQFKNIFKKIVTITIEKEKSSVSAKKLRKIAIKNNINSQVGSNFSDALNKISNNKEKLIVCFGSLYNCGNILNKN